MSTQGITLGSGFGSLRTIGTGEERGAGARASTSEGVYGN
jgi:hypothetical protein